MVIYNALAATLGASYGIYGPAFEFVENVPVHSGSEEYLNSEKYELRDWDLNSPHRLTDFISRVNAIRKDNPPLHGNERLKFHDADNAQLICYSKTTADLSRVILVVANLDSFNPQSGWVQLDLASLGLLSDQTFRVVDLLNGGVYSWQGPRNFVSLTPGISPAHIFRLER